MQTDASNGGVILRKDELARNLGVSRSWLERASKDGRFPKPIQLSAKSVGWLSTEVDAWLKARAAERDARPRSSSHLDDSFDS